MRALITGGAGFIGTNLVRWTRRHRPDVEITVLDALTYAGFRSSVPDDVRFVEGDVTDGELVDALVAEADVVLHLAAESHVDNALRDPAPFVHTNVVGTFTVLEAVRRHRVRLQHITTDEVFGDLPYDGDRRFDEQSPYAPSSPYSASKAGGDMLVRAWIRSYGIEATLTASSNNYGPYQHVEKLIPRSITSLLDGGRPRLFGDGRHVRDWLHVDDHAAAIWTVLERGTPGETYVVGADEERSNREVVELLLELMGQPTGAYDLVPDRPGHDRRYALDASRLRALGWEPQHADLRAGLAETVRWYRGSQDWWRPQKAATEARYAESGR